MVFTDGEDFFEIINFLRYLNIYIFYTCLKFYRKFYKECFRPFYYNLESSRGLERLINNPKCWEQKSSVKLGIHTHSHRDTTREGTPQILHGKPFVLERKNHIPTITGAFIRIIKVDYNRVKA